MYADGKKSKSGVPYKAGTPASRAAKITNWYGIGELMVEIASKTAVWYSTGSFAVPLRWVLMRDPKREFKTRAFLCTDLDIDPQKIVSWFVMRWQVEVTSGIRARAKFHARS
ncbi:MAG: hypothetical protein WKF53_01495 [Rubrobacter sp.]